MEAFITWPLMALTLVGLYFNIKKRHVCFWIWMGTSFLWAVISRAKGNYALSVFHFIFLLMSFYGAMDWMYIKKVAKDFFIEAENNDAAE